MVDDSGLLFCCSPNESAVCVSAYRFSSGDAIKHYKSEPDAGIEQVTMVGSDYLLGCQRTKPFIYVWALQKEQVHMRMSCPGKVVSMAVTNDGAYCAASIGDKIYIWQICSGHLMAVGSRHYQRVTVLRFTDDGAYLISGGDDNLVVVWSMSSLLSEAYLSSGLQLPVDAQNLLSKASSTVTLHTWSDHSLPISDMYCSAGGLRARVATVSIDQTCKLYELGSGILLCTFLFDSGLTRVTMDHAMSRLFVGGSSGAIWQVNLFLQVSPAGAGTSTTSDTATTPYQNGHSKPITGLCVTAYGNTLISGSADSTIRVWDIGSHQTIKVISLKAPMTDMLLTMTTPRNVTSVEPFKPAKLVPLNYFEKRLHFATVATAPEQEATSSQQQPYDGAIPLHINRIDPLVDLDQLEELKMSMDSDPISEFYFNQPREEEETLNPELLAKQVCKLKDVHRTLYNLSTEKILNSDRMYSNKQ